MGYVYAEHKQYVLTDEGQRNFLKVRDFCQQALKLAGAVRGNELLAQTGSGDSWSLMACIDRLVELGEIREVTANQDISWQRRVFVSGKGD